MKTIEALAVFIDMENLFGGYKDPKAVDVGAVIDASQKALRARSWPTDGIVVRAYANWSDKRLLAVRTSCERLGVETVQVQGTSDKNASDIHLAVDAMAVAFAHRPSTFIIVSNDGGLVPLVRQLRLLHRNVLVVGTESASSRLRAVTDFVDINAAHAENERTQHALTSAQADEATVDGGSRIDDVLAQWSSIRAARTIPLLLTVPRVRLQPEPIDGTRVRLTPPSRAARGSHPRPRSHGPRR